MEGMFYDLLVPEKDIKFSHGGSRLNRIEKWKNSSGHFEIERRTYGQSLWSWNPTQIAFETFIHHPNIDLIYKSIRKDFSNPSEAKQEAIKALKAILPIEEQQNLSPTIKRTTSHYYDITIQDVLSVEQTPVYLFGSSGDWSLGGYSGKKQIDKLQYVKTRKQLINNLYKYLSTELNHLYDKKLYTKAKNHLEAQKQTALKNDQWWISFVKLDVNLTEIFG